MASLPPTPLLSQTISELLPQKSTSSSFPILSIPTRGFLFPSLRVSLVVFLEVVRAARPPARWSPGATPPNTPVILNDRHSGSSVVPLPSQSSHSKGLDVVHEKLVR
ncbi:hypothetical protein PM082_021333 [Marasmius tenuissimus]|nr:hypothetical protein PM082_021333 [Marasmius tenuissimus]